MTCKLCDRPVKARGWCTAHYMRWSRTGAADKTITVRGPHTHLRPGSARHRIHQILQIDGGWMTKAMIAADFEMRWPDTNPRTVERAFHRLTNTDWTETRMIEGNMRTGWNGSSLVYELRVS